jgi:hypothetical protein
VNRTFISATPIPAFATAAQADEISDIRAQAKQLRFAKANRAFAIMPKPPPIGSGRPDRIITISENTDVAGITHARLPGATRWEVASDFQTEPEKWRRRRQRPCPRLSRHCHQYHRVNPRGAGATVTQIGLPQA